MAITLVIWKEGTKTTQFAFYHVKTHELRYSIVKYAVHAS